MSGGEHESVAGREEGESMKVSESAGVSVNVGGERRRRRPYQGDFSSGTGSGTTSRQHGLGWSVSPSPSSESGGEESAPVAKKNRGPRFTTDENLALVAAVTRHKATLFTTTVGSEEKFAGGKRVRDAVVHVGAKDRSVECIRKRYYDCKATVLRKIKKPRNSGSGSRSSGTISCQRVGVRQYIYTVYIYSQAIRYHRICSNPDDRDTHLQTLAEKFKQKGYKPRTIHKKIHSALQTPREHLLQYREKQTSSRIPLVATYNPTLEEIRKIIKDLQPILAEDEVLKQIFPEPPILAFRQPPNLKQKLVNRKLPTETSDTDNGTKPCAKPRCKLCQHICTNSEASHNNKTYNIKGQYSCTTENVVYMIQCTKCDLGCYIGETSQPLNKRMDLHRSSINNHREKDYCTPVGHHFTQTGHSLQDLKIKILKGNFKNTQERKTFEAKMIVLYDSKNRGLNVDLSFLSHYQNFL
ncbi:uncharacterized protein LOC130359365 [Hyla sarda]|uniref:uncharacterized protein LOC130359365 n=1 Tax=Hyla sarda TaxID=327740 RepID=UPI0024C34BCE|nr:uncharacterized protein LOC130359365 [Hyla sarda]